MRHSIKHWFDWVVGELLPPARPRSTGQSAHIRYEKAGVTAAGPSIPWNADAVVAEFPLRLQPAARHKADYLLRFPGQPPIAPEVLKRDDADERLYRIFFRFPPPTASTSAELLWKNRLLTTVSVPVLSVEDYLGTLTFANPTVTVRIGGRSIAASTFVASQCRGLTAAAVLRSPSGLAPLADLGMTVAFREHRTGTEQVVSVPLTAGQLASREALVSATAPKSPRKVGDYSAIWRIGSRPMNAHALTAISAARFAQSLRLSDARFAVIDPFGTVRTLRQPPPGGIPFGPFFVLASRELGAAGLADLAVFPVMPKGSETGLPLFRESVLVTDGPTAFVPGPVEASTLGGAAGFELRLRSRVLGVLAFCPAPAATFDGEGGFKPPPDFAWSSAADEELTDRLLKLMKDPRLES